MNVSSFYLDNHIFAININNMYFLNPTEEVIGAFMGIKDSKMAKRARFYMS